MSLGVDLGLCLERGLGLWGGVPLSCPPLSGLNGERGLRLSFSLSLSDSVSLPTHALRQTLQVHQKLVDVVVSMSDRRGVFGG